MAQSLPTYRFGPYELRTQSRELFKLGTRLRLRPQSYQVLELLLQRAGDAVSREEFHRALWSEAVVTDFELGLNTCIKELRGLLSDSATEPRYIQTLPKVGYRMIRAVSIEQVFAAEEVAAGNDKGGADAHASRSDDDGQRRDAWWKWGGVGALAIVRWSRLPVTCTGDGGASGRNGRQDELCWRCCRLRI